jgi:hypothetical protein
MTSSIPILIPTMTILMRMVMMKTRRPNVSPTVSPQNTHGATHQNLLCPYQYDKTITKWIVGGRTALLAESKKEVESMTLHCRRLINSHWKFSSQQEPHNHQPRKATVLCFCDRRKFGIIFSKRLMIIVFRWSPKIIIITTTE